MAEPKPIVRANWVSIWDLELWNQLLFCILSYHPFGSWHNQLWNKNTLNQIIFTPVVAALVTLSLSSLVLPYSRSPCVKYGSCMLSCALIRKSFTMVIMLLCFATYVPSTAETSVGPYDWFLWIKYPFLVTFFVIPTF